MAACQEISAEDVDGIPAVAAAESASSAASLDGLPVINEDEGEQCDNAPLVTEFTLKALKWATNAEDCVVQALAADLSIGLREQQERRYQDSLDVPAVAGTETNPRIVVYADKLCSKIQVATAFHQWCIDWELSDGSRMPRGSLTAFMKTLDWSKKRKPTNPSEAIRYRHQTLNTNIEKQMRGEQQLRSTLDKLMAGRNASSDARADLRKARCVILHLIIKTLIN